MIIQSAIKSKQGTLLLMAILILAGMITAASSLAIITMNNLNQAILVDNGIRAFYSAESGVEDALYEIRKDETPISELPSSGSLSSGAQWDRDIEVSIQQMEFDIEENDFQYIDLYDPDTSLSPLDDTIKSLRIEWVGDGSEWLEVQIVPWITDGTIGVPSGQLFSAASNPAVVNLQDSPSTLYRVRIKALYSDIKDVTVRAYSGLNLGGSRVNIPGFLTIYSTGEFSRTNQVVRAMMPHRGALSGQFGYVLFSEEDLIK